MSTVLRFTKTMSGTLYVLQTRDRADAIKAARELRVWPVFSFDDFQGGRKKQGLDLETLYTCVRYYVYVRAQSVVVHTTKARDTRALTASGVAMALVAQKLRKRNNAR